MHRFRLAVVIGTVGLAIAGTSASGQQGAATPSPGAISGIVIDTTTQKPVSGAVVRVSAVRTGPIVINFASSAPPIPGQLTDEQGRFIFTELPANEAYTLSASRIGYFDGAYGIAGGGAAARIVLASGQWFRDARIALRKPGAIAGTVTDEAQEPLVGVRVRLYADTYISGVRRIALSLMTTTDDRGRYRFANIRPGRYVIGVASVQDAVPAELSTFDLSNTTAQAVAAAEAAGRETTLRKDPSFAIGSAHKLVVSPETVGPPPSASGQPRAYPTTFYPSTRNWADARVVEAVPGNDVPRVDIQIRPVPVFRVSGRLDGPADAIGGVTVRLALPGAETAGRGAETATALTTAAGTFAFFNVPEGSYLLVASRMFADFTLGQPLASSGVPVQPPGSRASSYLNSPVDEPNGLMISRRLTANARYLGRQTVPVRDRDLIDLVVPMEAGVVMKGQLAADFAGSQPTSLGVRIDVQPANGDPTFSRLAGAQPMSRPGPGAVPTLTPTSDFTVEGLLPGQYVIRPSFSGWAIKSVVWNSKDYTHTPMEITGAGDITGVVVTFTDKAASVSGVIRDRAGQLASNAAAIIFPVEREQWTNYGWQAVRLRSAMVSTAAAYSLRTLPAGDYYIVAVPADQSFRWKDPTFLDGATAGATRITLAWSDTKTTDLVVQVIK